MKRGSTQLVLIFKILDMCNAAIGYMIWQHTFVLDSICRTVNIVHTDFASLRKVANNQNFSSLTSFTKSKFWLKIFCVSILQRLRKIPQKQQSYDCSIQRYSKFSQQPAFTQQPAPTRSMPASVNYHYGC